MEIGLMKYLVLTLTLIFSMSGLVNANSVNGSFVCELVYSDGSGQDVYITTTESGMTRKYIKYDDEHDYVEIHKGNTNDFRVFVQVGNWITEDVVVLTATSNAREFHYNGANTSDGQDSINARVVRGICNKL